MAGLRVDWSIPEVLVVCLDRPAVRNALDGPLVDALVDTIRTATARAVVLGSVDPRCFSAGADLTLADTDRANVSDRLYELYGAMIDLPAPIVAAVGGHAVGGGAQLALAADVRIGSPSTQFRFPGPANGLVIGAWALPSLVGRSRAFELCATMRLVGAAEALTIGLLDRVADDPLGTAIDLATMLASYAGDAVARLKAVVDGATGLRAALALEREANRGWSGRHEGERPHSSLHPPSGI